jgi:hypothetical protein
MAMLSKNGTVDRGMAAGGCMAPELFALQNWITICGPASGATGVSNVVTQPFDTWRDLDGHSFAAIDYVLRISGCLTTGSVSSGSKVALCSAYDETGAGEEEIDTVTIAEDTASNSTGRIAKADSRLGRYLYWKLTNGTTSAVGQECRVCFQVEISLK